MNGSIRNLVAVVGLGMSAALACAQDPRIPAAPPPGPTGLDLTGHNNRYLYDRCWPQRYNALSHRAVNRLLTPQVMNGHVLDQTIWNHMFEPGTDQLNGLGLSHLQYVSRRRPEADRTVFLAAAMDLSYDAACPERYAGARQELDSLRVAAVQKYLTALNAGRGQDYQVLVHDPADVSLSSVGVASSVTQMYGRFRGGIGAGGGAGGGAGAVGSVGGFAGAGGAAGR